MKHHNEQIMYIMCTHYSARSIVSKWNTQSRVLYFAVTAIGNIVRQSPVA